MKKEERVRIYLQKLFMVSRLALIGSLVLSGLYPRTGVSFSLIFFLLTAFGYLALEHPQWFVSGFVKNYLTENSLSKKEVLGLCLTAFSIVLVFIAGVNSIGSLALAAYGIAALIIAAAAKGAYFLTNRF